MTEEEKIKVIREAIQGRLEIETMSDNLWIPFRPYLLYQDVNTKRNYCYGYYADSEDGIEPKTFDVFKVDDVAKTDEEFIPHPFWRSHNTYIELTKQQLRSIEEIPFEI